MEWISTIDKLPEEGEYVLVYAGGFQIARIKKGISMEQRKLMERGEIEDPLEGGWSPSTGYIQSRRSELYRACDEQGNNRVPYCWYANGGPMQWFGQDVTHWMPLEKPEEN